MVSIFTTALNVSLCISRGFRATSGGPILGGFRKSESLSLFPAWIRYIVHNWLALLLSLSNPYAHTERFRAWATLAFIYTTPGLGVLPLLPVEVYVCVAHVP